jgi:signal transduction histidine kinase/CheY-like chemotaxis protein
MPGAELWHQRIKGISMTTTSAPAAAGLGSLLQGATARQRRILALTAWLMFATVLTLSAWVFLHSLIDRSSDSAITVTGERFRTLPYGDHPGSDWQATTLPDTWSARRIPSDGSALYEIDFTLSENPMLKGEGPWAVRIDRLSSQHRIWLNGHLIHVDQPLGEPSGRPMAYLAQVSADLLNVGANRLDVEVHYGSLGGLSKPIIGLMSEVAKGHNAQQVITERLPLAINVVSASFASFLIMIWLKRRKEVAIGMLGMLAFVVSVRNCTYYTVHGPTFPPMLSMWLFFTAQTMATVLLGAFAMAIARRWWPWLVQALWVTVIFFPIIAGVAAFFGQIEQARNILYPALLILMLPPLSLLIRVPAQYGGYAGAGMVLGIAVALVAGIHDYLRLAGKVPVSHSFWLPMASPITLGSYAIILVNRFVQAMTEIEQHNVILEQRVQERTRDLVAANAAKGHFLAAASHDLRQPVAAVGLLSGLLRERLKGTDMQDMTQRLSDAVTSMESLLSGLLDLSRLEAGAIKPHLQSVALGDMLHRIASHEREAAKAKGLQLRVRPTRAMAFSDPVLLEQMVRNLIGNAVRYTQRGGVLVGVRKRQEHLYIEVWDTGAGIADEDRHRIFEDFVQLSNPERNQAKGLGLGLAIVQRASKLLDHPIELESRVGRGSCFRIRVSPDVNAIKVPVQVATAEALLEGNERPLDGRHIIVLDDDKAVRHALAQRLKAWGAFVSPLECIDDLEELLQRVMHVDMLISDHQLADGDGFEAISKARALHPKLAAMIITGDTTSSHLQKVATTGVPVMHKPFQAEQLLRVMMIQLQADTTGGNLAEPGDSRAA